MTRRQHRDWLSCRETLLHFHPEVWAELQDPPARPGFWEDLWTRVWMALWRPRRL